MKAQEEFKYVVDGANVAYHHQNFDGGKFSFRQIELIVDSILARKDGKVLVLLPSVYAKKNIPNSSNGLKTRDRRDLISSDDEVCHNTLRCHKIGFVILFELISYFSFIYSARYLEIFFIKVSMKNDVYNMKSRKATALLLSDYDIFHLWM